MATRVSRVEGARMKKTNEELSKEAAKQTDDDDDAPTDYLLGPENSLLTNDELFGVPFKAPMIIESYLQQDAGGVVGSGETGKTTVMLFESVHIVLGRPLYGKRIVRSGGVLYLTAEDNRKMMGARLNGICRALNLTKKERDKIRNGLHIEDISATPAKLVESSNYGVHRTAFVDEIVEKYKGAKLAMVVLDPELAPLLETMG
jgi:RecA-family ATPase